MMFSLSKYNEITPCIRGRELLTSILDENSVSKLWLNSEHIFVSTKEQFNLYAFDVVPQLRWRRSVQPSSNDCLLDKSPEPVVEVIWEKSKPSFVFVISESGTTNFWEFLRPSHEWIKHKSVQLSNVKGSQIIDVKWHEESGNLAWCERRGFATDTYCVCYRSVKVLNKNEKAEIEIGSTQAILHSSPMVNVFAFSNGICIQPRHIYLEKIFMLWTSGRNIQSIVIKSRKVHESVSGFSDFRDISSALVGSWTENADDESLTWLGATVHPSTRDLLLLNRIGALLKLSIQANIVKLMPVCNIKLPLNIRDISDNVQVFTNGVTLGLIDCNSIVYIYDIVSGRLLQEFEEFSKFPDPIQVLESNSKQPGAIFWTSSGIWKLSCLPLTELVKTIASTENLNGEMTKDFDTESEGKVDEKGVIDGTAEGLDVLDIAKWLSLFGLKHSATVLLMEHVISRSKKGEKLPETTMQFLRKLGKDVFQNPGILLTFEDVKFKEESRNELKRFLDEIDQAMIPSLYMTTLNIQVLPFLRELLERWNEQIILPSVDFGKLCKVVKESELGDVTSAIESVAVGTPDDVCLEKMEILSLQQPDLAVNAFVKNSEEVFSLENEDEVNICAVLRAELKDRKWKRRRSPENTTIVGTMFRLLYKKHPEMILKVLEMAEKNMTEGASKDEATIQDLQDCVRDFIMDYLPNVWSEKDCDLRRIEMHAQVLLRLGLHRDGLQMYLQRHMWQEAVELYVELTRFSTDVHAVSQLYEILVAGILRGSGTSESQLLTKVFELKPKIIQVDRIFELCLRNTPERSMEKVFDEQCLTVGETKKALEQFLSKT